MAGVAGRSGGANRKPVAVHVLNGTFRPDRHGARAEAPAKPVSAAERRRALQGLSGEARRIAARLLDEYDGWDEATLFTLRVYAASCERLAALRDATSDDGRERRAETRNNLALLKALNLESAR